MRKFYSWAFTLLACISLFFGLLGAIFALITTQPYPTGTPYPTATDYPTSTPYPTATYQPSPTNTETGTPTWTPIFMNTVTPTDTSTSTVTGTSTPTPSDTQTPIATSTDTLTPVDSTSTPTDTSSPVATVVSTLTPTDTPTATETATETPTATETETETATATETATETETETATATETETPTETVTATETPTPTATETPTATPTPLPNINASWVGSVIVGNVATRSDGVKATHVGAATIQLGTCCGVAYNNIAMSGPPGVPFPISLDLGRSFTNVVITFSLLGNTEHIRNISPGYDTHSGGTVISSTEIIGTGADAIVSITFNGPVRYITFDWYIASGTGASGIWTISGITY